MAKQPVLLIHARAQLRHPQSQPGAGIDDIIDVNIIGNNEMISMFCDKKVSIAYNLKN